MIAELVLAMLFGLLLLGIHRKVIARIQRRPGPPVWQEILHAAKFSFKTTWVPATASGALFAGIVLVAVGIWTAAFFVMMTGGSLLIIFGIYMLHKIVEHAFGLSSGSPYGKFGGVRSVISAASEIPLFVSVAVIGLFTGSLELTEITAWEAVHGPLFFTAFPAVVAMYLVLLSKMPFGPFSIVESKELVSGYKTEHFGAWRAGLEVCNGLKTTVLLATFLLVFAGQLPVLWMVIGMILLTVSLSFACAVTPMLSPFDSVTIQSLVTALMLVYAGIVFTGVLP
ncbi:MAG: F(420)H(2) dehydrogenase subunit H [Methanoregula sp. PtaU1.Bin051]|nr:MAG: F(420)H(2) dehydrogenase subunit H [Methanoregula sp. PtaU1.Bin051]